MNTIKMLTIMFIVISIFLSGCINENKTEDKISHPLPGDFQNTTYENETIWKIMNVSSNLNKTYYITEKKITDIVDFYSDDTKNEEYAIKDGGASGLSYTNIDTNNISYGYVKLHKNNKTDGIFIFAIKTMNEMQIEKANLVGIATGPWNLIDKCEKTGNFTQLK